MVPRSPSAYSQFHTSPAVRLDDGTRLPVGRLTVGTGHAPPELRGAPAAAYYDNTGTCFALVRVGEDAHGIWFSGVVAPWATPEQIEQGLAAPLSGDWRDFGQGLELVAALAVNTPGFNVRPHGRSDEQDRPIALVASGRLSPRTRRGGFQLSRAELKSILREAIAEERREAEAAQRRAEALARAREAVKAVNPSAADAAIARAKAALGVKVAGGKGGGEADPTTKPKLGKGLKPVGKVKVAK